MRIVEIYDSNYAGETNFVNSLLEKGINSDFVFDRCQISMNIETQDWTGYIYRTLWETVYIHQNYSYLFHSHDDVSNEAIYRVGNLSISVSEALGFIYKATPPRLKHLIPDGTKNVEEIIKSLKAFLMDYNNPEYKHFMSIFKEHIRFQPFQTVSNIEEWKKKIALLRTAKPTGPIGYIFNSDIPFYEILHGNNVRGRLGVIFHASFNEDKNKLVGFIEDNDFSIDNVVSDNENIYVTAYCLDYLTNDKNQRFFNNSYKVISGG